MAMRRCPQPIISLIHGQPAAAGCRWRRPTSGSQARARMNCAYIRIGLGGCDIGSSYLLPRLVGASVAGS